jgi:hypothetical protein
MSFWDDLSRFRVKKIEIESTERKWLRLVLNGSIHNYYLCVTSDDGDEYCKIESVSYPGPFYIKKGMLPRQEELSWDEHEEPNDDYPDEYNIRVNCRYEYRWPTVAGDYVSWVLENKNANLDYARPYIQGMGFMEDKRMYMYRKVYVRPGMRRQTWHGHWILAR